MTARDAASRQRYHDWVDEQIEECKATLTRDELLEVAEQALARLFDSPDGQYPLTEILLCDTVDALLLDRLGLPAYRQWQKSCRNDAPSRPPNRTRVDLRAAS